MADFLTITTAANCICDPSGAAIATGKFTAIPTDSRDTPIPVKSGSQQVLAEGIDIAITGGALATTLKLPNPAGTNASPINFRFRFVITDLTKNTVTTYRNVQIADKGDGTWDFGSMATGLYIDSVVKQFIVGPVGPSVNYRGAWSPNTAYAVLDQYTFSGSSYQVKTAYTSGSTFGSADTTNTAVIAAGAELSGSYPGPLTIGGTTDAQGPDTPLDVVQAISVDSAGKLAVAVDSSGALVAYGGVKTFGATNGATDAVLGPKNEFNPRDLKGAEIDTLGRITRGIMPDGSELFPGGVLTVGGATKDADGSNFYAKLDTLGNLQIFRKDEQSNVMQLTSGNYNNGAPVLSSDGNTIFFVSDRDGVFAHYQMDKAGLVQVPLATDLLKDVDLHHVFTTGQSLSTGQNGFITSSSGTVRSTTQPYDNLMLNGGPRCGADGGHAIDPSKMTSLVPLTEVVGSGNDSVDGETISTGMTTAASAAALAIGKRLRFVATVNGAGGQVYTNLKKGTQTYANGTAQVSAAHSLAVTAGLKHAVRAMCVVHGESADYFQDPLYGSEVLEWAGIYNDDIKAITGQKYGFPCIMSQPSSWEDDAVNWTYGMAAMLMLNAWRANHGRILIACPKYFIPSSHYTPSGPHPLADDYRWIGEYYGRVLRDYLLFNRLRRPLAIRSAVLMGTKIYLNFWMPDPNNSLVIDTTNVAITTTAGGKYGFEYYDSTGASAPTIADVQLNGKTGIVISLSAAPTVGVGNMHIAYARTAVLNAVPGAQTGPRGNIRTDSTDPSPGGYGPGYLFDWLCHDDFVF